MIEINGLTEYEVKMLDILWRFETIEEVELFEEQLMIERPGLIPMFNKCRDLLVAHQLDYETNTEYAYEYLKRFMI